jgi:hypothetical protein
MSEFREALKRFVNDEQPEWLLLAKVTAVNSSGTGPTCTCVDNVGNEYLGVRLQTRLMGGAGTVVLHKVGSWVLLASIQGKDEHIAIMPNEIDKLTFRTAEVMISMTSAGVVIRNEQETLRDLMSDFIDAQSDLIDQIKLLTVTCAAPGSPSSPPLNVAAFTTLDTALTNLKTRFQSLLKSS